MIASRHKVDRHLVAFVPDVTLAIMAASVVEKSYLSRLSSATSGCIRVAPRLEGFSRGLQSISARRCRSHRSRRSMWCPPGGRGLQSHRPDVHKLSACRCSLNINGDLANLHRQSQLATIISKLSPKQPRKRTHPVKSPKSLMPTSLRASCKSSAIQSRGTCRARQV